MIASSSAHTSLDDDPNGSRLVLADSVIQTIGQMLPRRVDGIYHENVLYIAGTIVDSWHRIGLTAIAPECLTGPGFFRTDADAHVAVMYALREHALHLVAQVHCHPGRFVSHSVIDSAEAIAPTEGHWSIVVPHYGTRGRLPITDCGVHCYTQGEFRQLTKQAISARVKIAPDWIDLRGEKTWNHLSQQRSSTRRETFAQRLWRILRG